MPMAVGSALRETVGHGSLKWLPLLLALIGYNGLFAARLQDLADERVARRWRKPVAVGLRVIAGVWLAAQAALSILLR